MRKYSPIWKAIKKSGKVVIVVSPDKLATIKKGVIQEKWKDKDYHAHTAKHGINEKLDILIEGNQITFSMNPKGNCPTSSIL